MTSHKPTLQYLAEMYPTQPLSEGAAMEFSSALADLEAKAVLLAARKHYATDERGWRPTPGQIRAIVCPLEAADGQRAWDSVRAAVYAGRSGVQFEDLRGELALEAIGGLRQMLGGIDAERLENLRRRFAKAFDRMPRPPAPPRLVPASPAKALAAGGAR